MNTKRSKFLRAFINNNMLEERDILPIFREFRDIYNETFSNNNYLYSDNVWVKHKRTPMAAYASRELHFSDYKFPYDYTLYQLLESQLGDGKVSRINAAIGFRCRSLGMINHYDFDAQIVRDVEDRDSDIFLVVALRPLPDTQLYDPDNPTAPITTFEDYIRKGEDSSHTLWKDIAMNEFDRKASSSPKQIIQGVCRTLGNKNANKKNHSEKNINLNVGISKKIGLLLFSASGDSGALTRKKKEKRKKKRVKKPANKEHAEITSFKRYAVGEKVILDFVLTFGGEITDCTLSLLPILDTGKITTITLWEEACGIQYPAAIESFNITEIDGMKTPGTIETDDQENCYMDGIEFKLRKHNNRTTGVSLRRHKREKSIAIKMTFDQSSCDFKTALDLIEGGFEE